MQTADIRGTIRKLTGAMDRAAGELQALQRRDAELTASIGSAKGRIDRKDDVAAYLDKLQAAAHERNVGSYERLLTGLVTDIIDTGSEVGLELSTERGLPSLDIFMKRGDDLREDIMDGNGGGLTNVICLGLRAIATAKAHKRMFMALDEADCWIERGKIERFYSVIKQMASSVGLQCLFIAHHDISQFAEGIAVSVLRQGADGAAVLENDPRAAKWNDEDQPGIRFIRLVNFMSHVDTTLQLAPGVNALLGSVNLGKSVFMRALRAVAYGESADTDIRHGEKRLEAHIGLEHGRTLIFSRERKRSPVNLWAVYGPDGEIVEEHGTRYESGGRAVPDWVEKVLQMPLMDGLDIHVSHQKKPVFLLGDNASKRASVLSVGQESSHIQAMIARHKEWCTADNATIRNGEKEIGAVRARIAAMLPLEGFRSQLTSIDTQTSVIEVSQARVAGVPEIIARVDRAGRCESDVSSRVRILAALPADIPAIASTEALLGVGRRIKGRVDAIRMLEPQVAALAVLPSDTPEIADTSRCAFLAEKLKAGHDKVAGATVSLGVLSEIPENLPETYETARLAEITSRVSRFNDLVRDRERILGDLDTEIEACRNELAETLKASGNLCPLCQSEISHVDHLLNAAD